LGIGDWGLGIRKKKREEGGEKREGMKNKIRNISAM
jgi:hypothetical protein